MKCKLCNKEIVLYPSAQERAKKFGGKTSDYTALFTTHVNCQLAKNKRETLELIERKEGLK